MKKTTSLMILVMVITTVITSSAQKKLKSKNIARGTVYINAEYKPRQFSKILLITPSHHLETNDKMKQEFVKMGIVAVTNLELLPPVKEYTDADIKEICEKNNVDGILKVGYKSTGTRQPGLLEPIVDYEFDVRLEDLKQNLNAVTFLGWAEANSQDKATHKFIKAIIPDLEEIAKH